MNASNYLESLILNDYFVGKDVYLALYINDPTDSDTGTEVTTSGTSYERQRVTFSDPVQVEGRATVSNSAFIEFPIATADYGTVTHFCIRTEKTGGQQLVHGQFDKSKKIDEGDRFTITIGSLEVQVD